MDGLQNILLVESATLVCTRETNDMGSALILGKGLMKAILGIVSLLFTP
jgi:hypothetical protein